MNREELEKVLRELNRGRKSRLSKIDDCTNDCPITGGRYSTEEIAQEMEAYHKDLLVETLACIEILETELRKK